MIIISTNLTFLPHPGYLDLRINNPHHPLPTHPLLCAIEIMRISILNRDDEMLRRGRAVERHGYETGVEAVVEGFAGLAEVGFDYGMVLCVWHVLLVTYNMYDSSG